MKKLAALAVTGLGALTFGAATPSIAADTDVSTPTHHAPSPVVGNLQHTPMEYWCDKGVPSYVVAVRTVKAPEKSVTFTEVEMKETHTLGPVTHDKPLVIFSKINLAGKPVTLQVTGNTSGTTFTVSGTVPSTCAGLPKVQPNGSVTPAPGQTKPAPVPAPTKPMPTKPAPSMPAPTKPAPVPAPTKPMPTKPAPSMPAQPAKPATPAPAPGTPVGPKVQTDHVASTTGAAEAAGLALVAAAGAGVMVARRRTN